MNINELLDRWRCSELSNADLAELTRQLATREGRDRLCQDWFLEATLPTVLQTATRRQDARSQNKGWIEGWQSSITQWHPTLRWAAALGMAAVFIVILGALTQKLTWGPDTPPHQNIGVSASQISGSEDLQDLAIIVAKPPVPVLDSPQAAWSAVLNTLTERQN